MINLIIYSIAAEIFNLDQLKDKPELKKSTIDLINKIPENDKKISCGDRSDI